MPERLSNGPQAPCLTHKFSEVPIASNSFVCPPRCRGGRSASFGHDSGFLWTAESVPFSMSKESSAFGSWPICSWGCEYACAIFLSAVIAVGFVEGVEIYAVILSSLFE